MRGIYAGTNIFTDTVYYGQSKNIPKRLREHKNNLNRKSHPNIHLQASWNKYGEDAFLFTTVEIIEDISINLTPIEQKYIKNAYNLGLKLFNNSDPVPPFTVSLEVRKKISNTLTNRKCSEEHKKNISNSKKGNKNPQFGKKQSPERVSLHIERNKNRIVSEKTLKALQNAREGRVFSKEALEKMSKARKEYWNTKKPLDKPAE